jgi:hypothetical protein
MSFNRFRIFKEAQSSQPNQNFIKRAIEILSKTQDPISSSTLRMKIGDVLPKEDLPPYGKFNDWMSMISGIERNNTMQVDMPYYKLNNISKTSNNTSNTNNSNLTKSENESMRKLDRTVQRVKNKYEEWVIEWNKFNTENPSIEQWNILYERYNDLNKKIQTVRNFFAKHIHLIKDYQPKLMPKKPSDKLVYDIKSIKPIEEIKVEPVVSHIKAPEPRPNLEFSSSLFPNTSSSHPPIYNSYPQSSPIQSNYSLPLPDVPPKPQYIPQQNASLYKPIYNEPFYKNEPVFLNESQLSSSLFPGTQIPNYSSSNINNIFSNPDLYNTLIKLRGYGLMEPNSLAEKALILIEQMNQYFQ